MKDTDDNHIEKEEIDKAKLPTDADHPGEEISNENKIIIGDQVAGEEPSPLIPPKKSKNYVLILLLIVIIIIAVFWAMKGCNQAAQSALSFLGTIIFGSSSNLNV